jgi:hypothetical protein
LNKSFLILVIEAMVRRGGAALSILFCNEDCSLVHTSVLVTDRRGGRRREKGVEVVERGEKEGRRERERKGWGEERRREGSGRGVEKGEGRMRRGGKRSVEKKWGRGDD